MWTRRPPKGGDCGKEVYAACRERGGTVATREEKVKVLQSEVSDIDAAQRESAKVRQEEKANFLKTNKEYTEASLWPPGPLRCAVGRSLSIPSRR